MLIMLIMSLISSYFFHISTFCILAQLKFQEGERHLQKIRREYGLCVSDPSCWASGYNYEDLMNQSLNHC